MQLRWPASRRPCVRVNRASALIETARTLAAPDAQRPGSALLTNQDKKNSRGFQEFFSQTSCSPECSGKAPPKPTAVDFEPRHTRDRFNVRNFAVDVPRHVGRMAVAVRHP